MNTIFDVSKKLLSVIVIYSILMPCSLAQESVSSNSISSYSFEALKVIVSLAIVLGIFYLLIFAFKKYTGMNLKAHSTMKVLGGLSLGAKDKVVIIQAGKVHLLLSVSAAGVNKLHQFCDNELDSTLTMNMNNENFSQHISKVLNNKQS